MIDERTKNICNKKVIYPSAPTFKEHQEFVDRMLEMLDFNEAYDGNKIISDMYDNFGFRFKLVEK